MKAVLLCAGKSTRTYPLTLTRPKPLLPVAGATILETALISLRGLVNEVVLVVGYRQDMVRAKIDDIRRVWGDWLGMEFSFAVQAEQRGTAHAVLQAEPFCDTPFMVLNGDDLYGSADLAAMAVPGARMLVQELPDVRRFSSVITAQVTGEAAARDAAARDAAIREAAIREAAVRGRGAAESVQALERVLRVVEKPPEGGPGLAGLGMYTFEPDIFDFIKKTPLSERGEYELTETLNTYGAARVLGVHRVSDYWIPVGYPWSVVSAMTRLFEHRGYFAALRDGLVRNSGYRCSCDDVLLGPGASLAEGVEIKPPVVLGPGTFVGEGAVLSGPLYCGSGVTIGPATFIEGSVLFDGASVGAGSRISASVLGQDVKVSEGVRVNPRSFDGGEIFSAIKGVMEPTGMPVLGFMAADGAVIGAGAAIGPGVKLWPFATAEPSSSVTADLLVQGWEK